MSLKTELGGSCTLCYKPLESCSGNILIDGTILELCTFLIHQLDTFALLGSPICENCLIKIHQAYNFKSLQIQNSNLNYPRICNYENAVLCQICKNFVNIHSCAPLLMILEENDIKETISYLIPDKEIHAVINPMACGECQNTLLDLCDILTLLSIYQQRDLSLDLRDELFNIPESETINDINIKNEIESICIDLECAIPSKNSNIEVKTETMEPIPSTSKVVPEAAAGSSSYDAFMFKNEEVDLKMEQDDVNAWKTTEHEAYASAVNGIYKIIQCPGSYFYLCLKCGYNTKEQQSIDNHLLIHGVSQVKNLKVCILCSQVQEKGALINHMTNNHQDPKEILPMKCPFCIYQTVIDTSFIKHLRNHEFTREMEIYKCGFCNFHIKEQQEIEEHIKCHKKNKNSDWYNCTKCSFETKYTFYLTRHMKMHEYRDKNVGAERSHTETAQVEYHCKHCKFTASKKSALNIHATSHKITLHSCTKCNFCSVSSRLFQRHIFAKHKTKTKQSPKKLPLKVRIVYKCPVCQFETKRKVEFKVHNHIHHRLSFVRSKHPSESTKKQFKCEKCQFVARNKYSLQRHKKIFKHVGVTFYNCCICKFKSRKQKDLEHHMTRQHTVYKCRLCSYTTNKTLDMTNHTKIHENFKAETQELLEQHKNSAHVAQTSEKCPVDSDISNQCKTHDVPGTSKRKFKIKPQKLPEQHQQTAETSSDLEIGSKNNEKHIFPNIDKNSNNIDALENPNENSHKHSCPDCYFKTISPELLESHKKTEHSIQVKANSTESLKQNRTFYNCSECKFDTISKIILERHIQSAHCLRRCDLCKFKTNNLDVLKQHKHDTHETIYNCSHCNFITTFKNELKQHISRTHPPQKCELCEFKTYSERALNLHQDIFHKTWYGCSECEYVGKNLNSLQLHKELHHKVRYRCTKCDFETSVQKILDRHKHTHNIKGSTQILSKNNNNTVEDIGEPIQDTVYKCQMCQFQAKNMEILKVHRKIMHSWYSCLECQFKTTQPKLLEDHKVSDHSHNKRKRCGKTIAVLKEHLDYNRNQDKSEKCVCSNDTSDSDNLKNSAKVINTKTQEDSEEQNRISNKKADNFTCNVCKFTTTCETTFIQHMQDQGKFVSVFKCGHCSYITKEKSLQRKFTK